MSKRNEFGSIEIDSLKRELFIVKIDISSTSIASAVKIINETPVESGISFVIVHELDAAELTVLRNKLTHATQIPVQEISAQLKAERNRLYLMPAALMSHEKESLLDFSNSVMDAMPFPVVVLDKNLEIKSANISFKQKFSEVEERGENNFNYFIHHTKGVTRDLTTVLNKAFKDKTGSEYEFSYRDNSHDILNLKINLQLIKWDDSKKPLYLLLCIQDITERRTMLEKMNQALIAADHANHTKDMFLATLSHELRTPLTAILSWAQLLLQFDMDAEKIKRGLEVIEQNSKIQGKLIDDLLDISRIQADKLKLNISNVNPADIVLNAIDSVQMAASKKHIYLEKKIKPIRHKAAVDPLRLQQILWNLLINAINFSNPRGTVTIKVNYCTKNFIKYICIQIKDNGKGIEPGFIPHIFSRFEQADSSSTRQSGGLGLGLSIVNDLLKLMNGSIKVKSAGLGKGALFTVLLPIVIEKDTKKISTPKKVFVNNEKIIWPDLSGIRVLIVEDEKPSLDAMNALLTTVGAITTCVSSVREGLEEIHKLKPDVVISDIAMPDVDGISFIRELRSRERKRGKKLTAIAVTAFADKKRLDLALRSGFNEYIIKPFDATRFLDTIARQLKKQKS